MIFTNHQTLRTFLLIFCVAPIWNVARAEQMALVLGQPDTTQPFVSEILASSDSFNEGAPSQWVTDYTTRAFSVAEESGVTTVYNASVLSGTGSASFADIAAALEAASGRARVILTTIGGSEDGTLCRLFARYPAMAVVWVAGQDGGAIGDQEAEACAQPNILRVAYLNKEKTDLAERSRFGRTIRVAAAGLGVPTRGAGGKVTEGSPLQVAAVKVASRLALISAANPTWTATQIIGEFLQKQTARLPALEGKVEDQRALLE